ncbi:MAG TPA: hypothetical protein VMY41_04735 [Thermohalobaculum sp.]|nr:hypothetical protein [Thermohalobaculum sp.]
MNAGNLFHDCRRDERGTITIEFVLWTPVLALWLVASAAFFDAYKSRNDASKAAQTLADIASRQIEVSDTFLNELYALQDNLLPRAPEGTLVRVSSVQYVAAVDEYQVLWSAPLGGGEAMAQENIPLGILPAMADFDTVILTELVVPYRPFTNWAKIEMTEWSFALVSRPRFVSAIAKID